ncbi:MAG TPA: tripartite tricarboxylate transporter substrate binding protein [Xanthobacteraceae bacterium]|jgi:tripartite-type tricarboxylate transporter receptor subunit TctC|nr:tripartite tricarboxylate transporter substrate binding protein [Xanthobacteraceae bacterium]
MKVNRSLKRLIAAGALALFAAPSYAQKFPDHPITLVAPFPPGGTTDVLARSIAQEMSKSIGQQVIVENRAGASGMIGAGYVAKAAPDGYTILLSTPGPITTNKHLYTKMIYNPDTDLTPITQIGTVPQLLVVHPSVPAKSVKELIALAKSQPGKLNYGSVGNGSTLHLAGEMFNVAAGTEILHVPYKGSAPALTDLLGGQIQIMFDVIVSAMPLVKDGRLRALAVTSANRSKSAPDIPTIAESGLPGYNIVTWYGLMAPAKTPPEIVEFLNKETVKALKTETVQERLTSLGADLVASSPKEFAAYLKKESEQVADVVKKAKIPQQ